jgi:hypothetical protein
VNPQTRQKVLLGILGALLVALLWRYLGPAGEPEVADVRGRTATRTGSLEDLGDEPAPQLPGAGRRSKAPDQVVELRIADLERVPRDYAPGRDPWRFGEPPPPPPPPPAPPPKPPSPEELERQRQLQAELERQRLEAERLAAIERAKPRPPLFSYEYLGNFGPPGNRIAVFSDGNEIVNVRQGEVLEGKFIVAQIGYESVDIKFVGFPDEPPQRLAVGRRDGGDS